MRNYIAMGMVLVAGIVSFAVHAQSSRLGEIIAPKATVHKNEDIPVMNVSELLSIQLVRSQTLILGQTRLKTGSLSPHHNHPEEELIVLISGRIRVKTSDGDVVMEPGDVYVAEAYAEHQVEALEDSFTVEAFGAGRVINAALDGLGQETTH